MLEQSLLEGDQNSSTTCLEQQAHVQNAILQSMLSEELHSLTVANETRCGHASNDASSSGGSASGQTSLISAAGSQPHCYLDGTAFCCMNGEKKAIEDIREHDMLVSADGTVVQVKSNVRHASADRQMVMLETDTFKIPLTFNHRVVVLRGGSQQTIPAGHLLIGDQVLSASGEKRLLSVEHFFGDNDVYEMVLEPDAPMETFFIGDDEREGLLTKGKQANPRNRGYIRKK
jgi:hypothetical protein